MNQVPAVRHLGRRALRAAGAAGLAALQPVLMPAQRAVADTLPGIDPGTAFVAELRACQDAGDLAALAAVKGGVAKRQKPELDLARAEQDLAKARKRVEAARAWVRSLNDEVTQSIAAAREKA